MRAAIWPSALLILCAPRVVEVLALEQDPAPGRGEALGLVERGRPTDVALAEAVELLRGTRIGERVGPARSSSSSAGISVSGT